MLKQRLFYFCLFILMSYFVTAQELRCNISVSSQKIQGTNRELFTNMQRDMYEFLNNKRWSENIFQYDERIECSIQITLDEQIGSDQFRGSMQVRVSRPVYNSSYSTVLLNFRDNDIDYIYREFEPLEYSETGQNSNLVNFFNRAETIVARCQNAKESGWKSFENRRNRYWLINNLQDRSYASVRECIYKYHRLGLDVMSDNLTDGRLAILEALGLLQKAHRIKPNSYLMQVFFDAKADEIVHIFKPAFTDERKRIFNIVSEVNPANSSKYNALIQEKTN